jgi:lipid-binding SYLF domain-containing protein
MIRPRFARAAACAAVMFAMVLSTGCQTTPKTAAKREALTGDARAAVDRMTAIDPGLRDTLNNAYGYAVFPSVGKGGIIVGGAYGHGVVYEQGAQVGYADLTQATVGAQLGGQTYTELILFQTAEALYRFKNNQFAFSANASAVAVKAGAAAAAKYENGVAVFTQPNGGLMFEASVGGQKFTYSSNATAGAPGTTTRPAETEVRTTETRTETTTDRPKGVNVDVDVDKK